jgi:superfamily II DNA helicase RecQ
MNGFVPGSRVLPNASVGIPGRRILPNTSAATSSNRRVMPVASTSSSTIGKLPEDENVQKCYVEMKNIRQQLMAKYSIRQPGSILTDTALKNIAKRLPVNEREFLLVSNMKDGLYAKYGEPFLRASVKYDYIKKRNSTV